MEVRAGARGTKWHYNVRLGTARYDLKEAACGGFWGRNKVGKLTRRSVENQRRGHLERGGAPKESGKLSRDIHRKRDVRVNKGTAQLGAKRAY